MLAWVTQGPLTPRQLEHLGVSDRGVIMYRNELSDAIDAVERGEDPPGLVRNPEDNFPWIEIPCESTPRAAFRLAGQRSESGQVAPGAPSAPAKRRRVSALTPRTA
jgi:hypothetical protein